MSWKEITEADCDGRSKLVTNNLYALDAHGDMNHIWIGRPQPSNRYPGTFICFDDADKWVISLTHWHPLPVAAELGETS